VIARNGEDFSGIAMIRAVELVAIQKVLRVAVNNVAQVKEESGVDGAVVHVELRSHAVRHFLLLVSIGAAGVASGMES